MIADVYYVDVQTRHGWRRCGYERFDTPEEASSARNKWAERAGKQLKFRVRAEPRTGFKFFLGMHQPSDTKNIARSFVSVHRLKKRKSAFVVADWIMDSGAFTTILKHKGYPEPVQTYAEQIKRWSTNGNLLAAVAQDYMCEPHMLKLTGLTIPEHQRLTIERYDELMTCDVGGVYILPVLQGFDPQDYVRHIKMYGERLKHGAWVGVGSVCKRNGDPVSILRVLSAIKNARPDLRLHGFGLKKTALASPFITELLHTADSMAWSYHARINGRDGNSWREAQRWASEIDTKMAVRADESAQQPSLF